MVDLDAPLEPDPVIEAYKKHVDRTLLRQNLRRTVQERVERLIELQLLAEEVRRAGRAARRPQDLEAIAEPEPLHEEHDRDDTP